MAGTQRSPICPGFESQLPWASYGVRLRSEPSRHRDHSCSTQAMVKLC